MSQDTGVVVAHPDDSSDVAVKAHMAVDDRAEGLQLRRETGRAVRATLITETAAAERSWAGVMPRIMRSDLLAFSCKQYRRNQVRTAVVHWLRR